jgi:hypothetical protein
VFRSNQEILSDFIVNQEIIMQYNNRCHPQFKLLLHGAMVALVSLLPVSVAQADDEIRAGAMVQIPFSLSSGQSFIDYSTIRVGLTCQYADVEEDEITITHRVNKDYLDGNLQDTTERSYISNVDEGSRVYGLEGNLLIEPFGNWNPSVELLGFYGNTDIQGALGAGYDFSEDWFLDAKVMFPYAEIGLRFPNQLEIYGGLKTLGDFNPAKEYHRREVIVVTEQTVTVSEE